MCKNLINQKQKNWIENLNQGSQTEELTSSPPLKFSTNLELTLRETYTRPDSF